VLQILIRTVLAGLDFTEFNLHGKIGLANLTRVSSDFQN
jgi:hypothetical protein